LLLGLSKFTLVSGCGWLIDVWLTMGLVALGVSPFWASLVGAFTAVTFVYVVALKAVFSVSGRFGARGFPAYVLWQCVAISIASLLVAWIALRLEPIVAAAGPDVPNPLSLGSGIAKAIVTPVTLLANFLFMRWLTSWLRSKEIS